MRRVPLLLVPLLLIALVFTGCDAGKTAAPDDGPGSGVPVTAFVHVNLVPMTQETVLADQTVLVEGPRIVQVGPSDMDEIAHVEELDFECFDFDRDVNLTPDEWLSYLMGAFMEQYDIAQGFDAANFQARHGATLAAVADKLRAAGVPVCTTLVIDDVIVQKLFHPRAFKARPENAYLPQGYMDAFDRGAEKHQRQFKGVEDLATFKYGMDMALLRALHGAGVPLLLATDCGTGGMGIVPGFSIHDELRILTENGFTPYQALAAGTVAASEVVAAMRGVDDFGTVEVGKRADLLLLRENPLEDVAHVRAPLGMMAAGRWYPAETLAAMIALDD